MLRLLGKTVKPRLLGKVIKTGLLICLWRGKVLHLTYTANKA